MSRCIVSVAFRYPYVDYLAYFLKSLDAVGNAIPVVSWRDELPPGSPTHQQVNYAFKWFAIAECIKRGFTSILWLDCACYARAPLEPLFDLIERDGHHFIYDDNALGKWISDKGLDYFKVTRDEAMTLKLMCGTCYGFDTTNPRTQAFLQAWRDSYDAGFWGQFYGGSYKDGASLASMLSSDPRCCGHRSDEAAAAIIAHRLGMATTSVGHSPFGGGICYAPHVLINSGYDLSVRKPL
jgi:hypothetical protein